MKIEIRNLDSWYDLFNMYAYQKGIAQLKSAAIPFSFNSGSIYFLSFKWITYAYDVLDEFNVKMTVSKSWTTCKILQYLAEPSKVLQKML